MIKFIVSIVHVQLPIILGESLLLGSGEGGGG